MDRCPRTAWTLRRARAHRQEKKKGSNQTTNSKLARVAGSITMRSSGQVLRRAARCHGPHETLSLSLRTWHRLGVRIVAREGRRSAQGLSSGSFLSSYRCRRRADIRLVCSSWGTDMVHRSGVFCPPACMHLTTISPRAQGAKVSERLWNVARSGHRPRGSASCNLLATLRGIASIRGGETVLLVGHVCGRAL